MSSGVDVAEVVPQEARHRLAVLAQLGGHRRAPGRHRRDLVGLLLLELDLERGHRNRPFRRRPARRCADPSNITRRWQNGPMDITTDLDFAADPATVHAMMLDEGYQEEVCVASHSSPLGGGGDPDLQPDPADPGRARRGRPLHRPGPGRSSRR